MSDMVKISEVCERVQPKSASSGATNNDHAYTSPHSNSAKNAAAACAKRCDPEATALSLTT